jgi:predicted cupin superfamily sugar epimerase
LNEEAGRIVRELELAPHPEGGFFREIFRSPRVVVDARGRTRSALTVIYYLLTSDGVSAWHRLASDETWHYARGSGLELVVLYGSGGCAVSSLGSDGPYVATIPAGRPFAARVLGADAFTLVTCCVAPGFEFEDFELLDPELLRRESPGAEGIIAKFSRDA